MSTLVVLMAAVALIVALASWQIIRSQKASLKVSNTNLVLQMLSRNIVNSLENDQAWLNTINANNLNCLKPAAEGTRCNPGSFGNLKVLLADNSVFLTTDATSGFTASGQPCNTYDATGAHPNDCIYRFTARWQCLHTPCETTHFDSTHSVPLQPAIQFVGTLEYAPYAPDDANKRNRVSTDYYGFNVTRAKVQDSLSSSCALVGGVFDQETQHCQLMANSICPNGSYLASVQGNGAGAPNCGAPASLLGHTCGAYTGVTGFSLDGSPLCFPYGESAIGAIFPVSPPADGGDSGFGGDGDGATDSGSDSGSDSGGGGSDSGGGGDSGE